MLNQFFALLLQAQQLKQAVYDPMTSWHAEYDRIKVRRPEHPKVGSGSGFAVSGLARIHCSARL